MEVLEVLQLSQELSCLWQSAAFQEDLHADVCASNSRVTFMQIDHPNPRDRTRPWGNGEDRGRDFGNSGLSASA